MAGAGDEGTDPERPVPPLLAAAHPEPAAGTDAPERVPGAPGPPRTHELDRHWGLFGPDSITWRVHSDPLIGLATLRSLIMRVLHPNGVAGVFATARRVDDPWERLSWTQRHLGVVCFGDSAEAAMAGARVRAVLTQVAGIASDGRHYRGDDPDLLLWLHCCQVASFVETTRRGGLELADREHEVYLREQVRTAALWGLEPDEVPTTRSELTRYFRSVRSELRMTAAARTFIAAVVAPALPEVMTLAQRDRPPWAAVAGLAFGSLPFWGRRLYSTSPAVGSAALGPNATTVALHHLRDSLLGRPSRSG
jgi:uncharacterized protein (DUF2236 family)